MTTFKLTKRMLEVGNAPYIARANAKLAAEIRTSWPKPVAHLSDKQLVWMVGQARDAAVRFGVKDPMIRKRWIMVHALLVPFFFTARGVEQLFANAFGDPDDKAADVLQQIKVQFCEEGFSAQIWW